MLGNLSKITKFFSSRAGIRAPFSVSKIFGERLGSGRAQAASWEEWLVPVVCKCVREGRPCQSRRLWEPNTQKTLCGTVPKSCHCGYLNSPGYPFALESSRIGFICQQRDGQLFWKPTQQAPIFTGTEVTAHQQLRSGKGDFYRPR